MVTEIQDEAKKLCARSHACVWGQVEELQSKEVSKYGICYRGKIIGSTDLLWSHPELHIVTSQNKRELIPATVRMAKLLGSFK